MYFHRSQNSFFVFNDKGEYLDNGNILCYKYSDTTPEGYSYTYIENHEDDTTTFIKTVKISSYGTGIEPVVPNDQAPGQYEITLMFTSSGGNETLVIDAVNGMVKGKKLRGGFF